MTQEVQDVTVARVTTGSRIGEIQVSLARSKVSKADWPSVEISVRRIAELGKTVRLDPDGWLHAKVNVTNMSAEKSSKLIVKIANQIAGIVRHKAESNESKRREHTLTST